MNNVEHLIAVVIVGGISDLGFGHSYQSPSNADCISYSPKSLVQNSL